MNDPRRTRTSPKEEEKEEKEEERKKDKGLLHYISVIFVYRDIEMRTIKMRLAIAVYLFSDFYREVNECSLRSQKIGFVSRHLTK